MLLYNTGNSRRVDRTTEVGTQSLENDSEWATLEGNHPRLQSDIVFLTLII